MSDEFFIGYESHQPVRTARFAVVASGVLLVTALALAFALSALQESPADASFDFGVYTDYEGVVRFDPYPRLEMPDGSTVLLAAPFKYGADETLMPYSGARIGLRGSLIHRGDLRMVEIDPESVRRLGPGALAGGRIANEAVSMTVRGEILDAKCWLGVMKPGHGTVHRACARLCLRGGLPALISFVDEHGQGQTALITTGGDTPIPDQFLRWIGRPVEVTGSWDPEAAGGIGLFTVDSRSVRVL